MCATISMAGLIEAQTGVTVVSVTYDGTGGGKNDAIIPYLKFPRSTLNSGMGLERPRLQMAGF